jgi:valyl-tRNA synthetase
MIKTTEFYIPLANNINPEEDEIERLTKELEYSKGFLKSVQIKLVKRKICC